MYVSVCALIIGKFMDELKCDALQFMLYLYCFKSRLVRREWFLPTSGQDISCEE